MHAAGSSNNGASHALIAAVKAGTWREHDDLDDAERVVLTYAEAMTATPPDPTVDLIAAMQQWFDSAAIVEITAAIAFENYRARLNVALGIEGHTTYQPPTDAPDTPTPQED